MASLSLSLSPAWISYMYPQIKSFSHIHLSHTIDLLRGLLVCKSFFCFSLQYSFFFLPSSWNDTSNFPEEITRTRTEIPHRTQSCSSTFPFAWLIEALQNFKALKTRPSALSFFLLDCQLVSFTTGRWQRNRVIAKESEVRISDGTDQARQQIFPSLLKALCCLLRWSYEDRGVSELSWSDRSERECEPDDIGFHPN